MQWKRGSGSVADKKRAVINTSSTHQHINASSKVNTSKHQRIKLNINTSQHNNTPAIVSISTTPTLTGSEFGPFTLFIHHFDTFFVDKEVAEHKKMLNMQRTIFVDDFSFFSEFKSDVAVCDFLKGGSQLFGVDCPEDLKAGGNHLLKSLDEILLESPIRWELACFVLSILLAFATEPRLPLEIFSGIKVRMP
jgi:hypothetical protein